jgi:hypothetical protein
VLLLAFVLAAAPVKLAAPGMTTIGLAPELGVLFTERLAVLAKQPDLSIVTARDVQQVLGMERQRQLLGCTATTCIAELAGALGADALLSGSLAHSGNSYTLVLRVIRASDGSELVSASTRASSEDGLQEWLEAHAAALGRRVLARIRGEPEESSATPPRWLRWASLSLGVAAGAGGGVLFGLSRANANELGLASPSHPVDATVLAANGKAFEAIGLGLMIAGGALLVVSVVLFALPSGDSAFTLVPTANGALFAWGGRW